MWKHLLSIWAVGPWTGSPRDRFTSTSPHLYVSSESLYLVRFLTFSSSSPPCRSLFCRGLRLLKPSDLKAAAILHPPSFITLSFSWQISDCRHLSSDPCIPPLCEHVAITAAHQCFQLNETLGNHRFIHIDMQVIFETVVRLYTEKQGCAQQFIIALCIFTPHWQVLLTLLVRCSRILLAKGEYFQPVMHVWALKSSRETIWIVIDLKIKLNWTDTDALA